MKVVVEAPHAKRQFDRAPSAVRDALVVWAARLAEDPHAGTRIRLAGVPRRTRATWKRRVGDLRNLAKVDLPGAWRAPYTIFSQQAGGRAQRCILDLEILDHHSYDRLLGYSPS